MGQKNFKSVKVALLMFQTKKPKKLNFKRTNHKPEVDLEQQTNLFFFLYKLASFVVNV